MKCFIYLLMGSLLKFQILVRSDGILSIFLFEYGKATKIKVNTANTLYYVRHFMQDLRRKVLLPPSYRRASWDKMLISCSLLGYTVWLELLHESECFCMCIKFFMEMVHSVQSWNQEIIETAKTQNCHFLA